MVAENDGIVQIVATGGESELDFDFELLARADLKVLQNGTALTLNLQYTIPDESLNDPSGGTITLDDVTYFPDGATADDVFTLILDPAAERTANFSPGGGIPYSTLNTQFDRIWQYLQKLARNIARAPRIAEDTVGKTLTLPDPQDEMYWQWDGVAGAVKNVSGASFVTYEPEFRYSTGYLQWKLTAGTEWQNLVDISAAFYAGLGDLAEMDEADIGTVTPTAGEIPRADGSGYLVSWIPDASATVSGKVELATSAETITGTDTGRAVTPAGAKAATDAAISAKLDSSSVLHVGTAVASTSGTSIDFTDIPSWVKRIQIIFRGVSTNGTDNVILQIGDSGGIETSSYISTAEYGYQYVNSTTGFVVNTGGASDVKTGIFTLVNIDGNEWVSTAVIKCTTTLTSYGAGSKTLSGTLDRVRLTTTGGTNTFDAGKVNVIYE
ncbi:MAG: hypothetical protein HGA87_00730 [Desulfobulbaceae bacterium]|nr:hypothetical protein [Desulfobulbaceae bacterium]